jgi:hypothetical protein
MNFLSKEGLSNSNCNVQFPGLGNAFSTASSQILNLRQWKNLTICNLHNSPQNRKFSFVILKLKGTSVYSNPLTS